MSEDIKKTINELHIYEKKLLKELEANPDATPEEIAENTGMDIKSVMSAAGSLASKDIIEVEKDVEEVISLSEAGKEVAENKLPERKILDVLAEKKEIHMKDLSSVSGLDKKDANIAIGWLRRKNWAQIDKGVVKVTDLGADYTGKLGGDEELLNQLSEAKNIIKDKLSGDLLDGFKKLNDRKTLSMLKRIPHTLLNF